MATQPQQSAGGSDPNRLDVPLQELLTHREGRPDLEAGTQVLPEPVYPQVPEDADESDGRYHRMNTIRAFKAWGGPYLRSRLRPNQLRPIIPYMFTEFKCNLDCHYCWSYNNAIPGMTEDTARRSIDWLHSIGARVLALMGGEPLLRPDFIHKVTYYASQKGFFVYLPTNGRRLKPEVTDKLGDAGMATVNLAVDTVDEKPGLPKALNRIRPYFEYLMKRQRRYGYSIVLNINITRINMDDVRQLTEIGYENNIITDYHINEAPMIEQSHFQHLDDNSTYITPNEFSQVDDLLDWLIDKSRQGYRMVNPRFHLKRMKQLMRGKVPTWNCRAGQNSLIIREDGTLAPCFPMYSATHDWGTIEAPRFDVEQLDEMKQKCTTHCLSTCNYILGYCYDNMRVFKWIGQQARRGFRGVSGAFDVDDDV